MSPWPALRATMGCAASYPSTAPRRRAHWGWAATPRSGVPAAAPPRGGNTDRGEPLALGGELVGLVTGQVEIGCGDVVTQLIERAGTGDRDDVGLADQPGQRDLRWCRVVGLRDAPQRLDDWRRALEVLGQAQRVVASRGTRRQVSRVVPAAEHALLERAVRDDNAVMRLCVGNVGCVGLAPQETEVHLVRQDCTPELALGGAPALRGEVAHPDVVHGPRILEALHPRHRRVQRHERVGPVDLIQID